MSIKKDLQEIGNLIKQIDDHLKTMTDMSDTLIEDVYCLDLSIKDKLRSYTVETIESLTEEEVSNIIQGVTGKDYGTAKEQLEHLYSLIEEEMTFETYLKQVMVEIKKSLDQIDELEKQKKEIQDESNKIVDNYVEYLNSPEYQEKKKKKIQDMKDAIDKEENTYKKNQMKRKVTALEKSQTMEFLEERITSLGEKEIDSIKNSFFDTRKSSLIMDKFKSKFPKYGFNENSYKMFFNLEEKFLPDEYNKYNNLFLFHAMRFISYTDPYDEVDSLYAKSIVVKLYDLLYHRFHDNEAEEEFINIIKNFDDRFNKYEEEFITKNITSPEHPKRQERDKEYEEKRRLMVIASLQNEGIEVDTSLETSELKAMLEEVISKKSQGIDAKEDRENEVEFMDEKEPIDLSKVQPHTITDSSVEEIVEEIHNTAELTNKFQIKGNVDYASELPSEGNVVGDTYLVRFCKNENDSEKPIPLNENYVWVGTEWVGLGAVNEDAIINTLGAVESSEAVADFDKFLEEIGKELHEGTLTSRDVVTGEYHEGPLHHIYEEVTDETPRAGMTKETTYTEDTEEKSIEDVLNELGIEIEVEEESEEEAPEQEENKESNVSEEESMIIERRFPTDTQVKEKEKVEIYKDMYECYYIENNGTYAYCDKNNDVIEENIPEETILSLLGTGSLTKTYIEL